MIEVYYALIDNSDCVYVLDESKKIVYKGSREANDVLLESVPQLHDDDSETYRLAVRVGGKTSFCIETREFGSMREFSEWVTC